MHLMYVDESGDPGYSRSTTSKSVGGPTPFFVRAGVVLHDWKWKRIHQVIAEFKQSRQLSRDAEIKTTHLRAGKRAFARWPSSDRQQFLLDLLETIGREIDVHLLVVAIDKARIDRTQRKRYTNPSVRSLELLLERYNQFLQEQKDLSGIVILDAVEAKNDENLRYFENYLLQFSDHLDPRRIVEGTLFMPSHTANLLQLADLCANVMYRRYSRSDRNKDEYWRIEARVWREKLWAP